ncbi:hypothetical protein [Microbispora sp. NBRC 16548]|uniref:hypothetical protein n=1 Tax=Microbispora sp. NBRC 16548 TaxID=3030994 RepID=UPI0024A41B35|nr:hypothetical protein [Microbispora sp. NBRC 16548]GLX08041.1 hypothetical protein Misp03_49670 [Microbispora sp. NBRC 16548]
MLEYALLRAVDAGRWSIASSRAGLGAVIIAPHVVPQPGPAPSAALSRTVGTRPTALDARSVLLAAA